MNKLTTLVGAAIVLGLAAIVSATVLRVPSECTDVHAGIETDGPGDTLWTRTFGGVAEDQAYSVEQTDDGGYVIAGHTKSFGAGYRDVYLVKTDASGATLWTRTYGGSSGEEAYGVQQTSDGGYIIGGCTGSFGAGSADVYLIKTDGLGDTLWTRTYGGSGQDEAFALDQADDGGYLLAGWTPGVGHPDMYLVKTDSVGDPVWTRTYGGSGADCAFSVAQTDDGGFIVAGYTWSSDASYQFYLVKTDSSGDTLWTRTYGGSDTDWAYSVAQTDDAGYIIAGRTESFGGGDDDVYLIKTDSLGDTLWTRLYGGSIDDYGFSVAQTQDGGYIIAGSTNSFGTRDVYLIKTDENGDTLWTRTHGGSLSDYAESVQQTDDGGYIVAGYTTSFGAGDFDFYLIKTEAMGPLSVEVTPDTTEVHRGEQLWFAVDLVNLADTTLVFDAWVDGYLFNGNPYGGNPVLGPVEVTLGGGQGVYGIRRHVTIPWGAPFGSPYKLCVRTGEHPGSVWAQDCFEFAIVPPVEW